MSTYKLTRSSLVILRSDGASIPADPDNTDYAEYLDWLAAGGVPDPVDPPTLAESLAAIAAAITRHVDVVAQGHQYADGVACASYVTSSSAAWANDSRMFVSWRDAVWQKAISDQSAIIAGTMALPTDVPAYIATFPTIVWPS